MSGASTIEWTDASWNPTRGCRKISPGCKHCYAETFAERFRGVPGHPYERGFDPRLAADKLDAPLRWRKPRKIFVNSMSDLFLEDFENVYVAAVFGVMAFARQHTFQVLTKRPERAAAWFDWIASDDSVFRQGDDGTRTTLPIVQRCLSCASSEAPNDPRGPMFPIDFVSMVQPKAGSPIWEMWPLRNVNVGVSVEDRKYGVPRIDVLRRIPAAVRFLSIEPLLEDVGKLDLAGIHQVIVGAESGRGARPFQEDWARSLRDQCQEQGVAFFYKQRLDERGRKVSLPMLDGRSWAEQPGAAS